MSGIKGTSTHQFTIHLDLYGEDWENWLIMGAEVVGGVAALGGAAVGIGYLGWPNEMDHFFTYGNFDMKID